MRNVMLKEMSRHYGTQIELFLENQILKVDYNRRERFVRDMTDVLLEVKRASNQVLGAQYFYLSVLEGLILFDERLYQVIREEFDEKLLCTCNHFIKKDNSLASVDTVYPETLIMQIPKESIEESVWQLEGNMRIGEGGTKPISIYKHKSSANSFLMKQSYFIFIKGNAYRGVKNYSLDLPKRTGECVQLLAKPLITLCDKNYK